jgi:transcriptional regulator with XRE-family HTH domain
VSVRKHIGCTGEELAVWREKMQWTQERAARELGIFPRSYQRYESGAAVVPLAIWRSAKLLYLSSDAFRKSIQGVSRLDLLEWLEKFAREKGATPEIRAA